VTFVDAIKVCLNKYVVFSGVAGRAEFWYFRLFAVLVSVVASVVDQVTQHGDSSRVGTLGTLVSLGLFLPDLTVTVRRFRDAGFHPLWLLLTALPLAGVVVWLVTVVGSGVALGSSGELNSNDILAAFAAPASLAALGFLVVVSLGVGVFFLVVTLLPSKSIEQATAYSQRN